MELELKILDKNEVESVFINYMKADFPANELKPLSHMIAMTDAGIYKSYGLFIKDELAGYAFFVTDGNGNLLLDYFAVLKSGRGKGIGSAFLEKLAASVPEGNYVIIEVEDPDEAPDGVQGETSDEAQEPGASDKETRLRRIRFYERAGVYGTDVRTRIYDADYMIMLFSGSKRYDTEQALGAVEHMYRVMFSAEVMEKHVDIKTVSKEPVKGTVTKRQYRAIYRYLDAVSPLEYDCGTICGEACCVSDDGREMGIWLLPGEEDAAEDDIWMERRSIDAGKAGFPGSWKGMVYYVNCKGPTGCIRKLRPIQCRTFPLMPYISPEGEFDLLYNDMDLPYSCPLAEEEADLDERFIDATYTVWLHLIRDPLIYDLVWQDSRIRDDSVDLLAEMLGAD